jgi:hypothetical protein
MFIVPVGMLQNRILEFNMYKIHRDLGTHNLDLGTHNLDLGTHNLDLGTHNLDLGTYFKLILKAIL